MAPRVSEPQRQFWEQFPTGMRQVMMGLQGERKGAPGPLFPPSVSQLPCFGVRGSAPAWTGPFHESALGLLPGTESPAISPAEQRLFADWLTLCSSRPPLCSSPRGWTKTDEANWVGGFVPLYKLPLLPCGGISTWPALSSC